MAQSIRERARVNAALNRAGLDKLNSPGLLSQLAYGIRSHDQFRQLLMKVAGDKRKECYGQMAPHLRFKPHTLDHYITETRIEADRMRLPAWDDAQKKVVDYDEYNPKRKTLDTVAQQAIETRRREDEAKGKHFSVTCRRCTFTESFATMSIDEGQKLALKKGWLWEYYNELVRGLCPKCVKERIQ